MRNLICQKKNLVCESKTKRNLCKSKREVSSQFCPRTLQNSQDSAWSKKSRVPTNWHLCLPQCNYQDINLLNLCNNVIVDLDWACEMLQCGTHLLTDALTKRTVEAGNERMTTPLTPAQVCISTCLPVLAEWRVVSSPANHAEVNTPHPCGAFSHWQTFLSCCLSYFIWTNQHLC